MTKDGTTAYWSADHVPAGRNARVSWIFRASYELRRRPASSGFEVDHCDHSLTSQSRESQGLVSCADPVLRCVKDANKHEPFLTRLSLMDNTLSRAFT